MRPLIILNTVALTHRRLSHVPRLQALAKAGWTRRLREVVPAVTSTAQASMLTGKTAQEHGIVGTGWFWRDTSEVRFWLQSNRLIQAEPFYQTARRRAAERGKTFRSAKLFWWFNQGAAVDFSVTPKPHYGADGNKVFDVTGTPDGLTDDLQRRLGTFPFQNFWGPASGRQSSLWIGQCAAAVLQDHRPELTLVYLPHLDYDTQRFGPEKCVWSRLGKDLDAACEPILDAARQIGARVWVVNEYAHFQVNQPIEVNRKLRLAGLLNVRRGPFGDMLDTFNSRAFAVCDHQLAHVYVNNPRDREVVTEVLRGVDGIERIVVGEERETVGLLHPRTGDLVLFARPNAWFAYPFWLEDRCAPDYARTVNIHAKPGYDPCELFFDPKLWWAKGRAVRRLLQKKLGFRTLFDVVPLDATLVKGSHGLPVENTEDRPLMIGDGEPPAAEELPMTAVRDLALAALELQTH